MMKLEVQYQSNGGATVAVPRHHGQTVVMVMDIRRGAWESVPRCSLPPANVTPTLLMANQHPSRRRLVGQPLLYAVSIFASLGVFLVSYIGWSTYVMN
jgi:hypothetical protein